MCRETFCKPSTPTIVVIRKSSFSEDVLQSPGERNRQHIYIFPLPRPVTYMCNTYIRWGARVRDLFPILDSTVYQSTLDPKIWRHVLRTAVIYAPNMVTDEFCHCGSPVSLLLTAQAVLTSLPPRAGVGASAPLDTAPGFLFAFIVASSEVSASSGNGARRLDERPCRRVWVNLRRRNRFDILLHQDWRVEGAFKQVSTME